MPLAWWSLGRWVRGRVKAKVDLKFIGEHKIRGWLKPSEAAQYSGVSLKVFRSWLNDGLRHSRLPNGRILVSVSAIDEFLNSFEFKGSTSQTATELLEGLIE